MLSKSDPPPPPLPQQNLKNVHCLIFLEVIPLHPPTKSKEYKLLSQRETPCSDVSSGLIPPVYCQWYDGSPSTSWHTSLSQFAVKIVVTL